MQAYHYTVERNIQILIALLKKHGIKRVVASPGGTNIGVVASLQQDPFFELYSSVDERSAAYLACGLAAETGEPVALSCTGATAARNYVPGLTEAFYRKLPVLAITSTRSIDEIGHNVPQVTDRTMPMKDIAKTSVYVPTLREGDDEWGCVVNINKAILSLTHRGGGPAHINLMTCYSEDFSAKALPEVRAIYRHEYDEKHLPAVKGDVAIFVASHALWSAELTEAVDAFCERYNGVVVCDSTSNYRGKYGVPGSIVTCQSSCPDALRNIPLMIHIGDISGAYMNIHPLAVWRVNPDGEVRDTFKTLTRVFEMKEVDFFKKYNDAKAAGKPTLDYYHKWRDEYEKLLSKVKATEGVFPFSNLWMAIRMHSIIPDNSVLHLGILRSLQSWNHFETPKGVACYSNVGGFGIDGCVSSAIGASLANSNKLFFCIVGDLAFFYDLNAMGNRHIGSNIRIMLVNNGKGSEFCVYTNLAARAGMGKDTDEFVAAARHFGNQSRNLVRHLATDLGFEYLAADNKKDFEKHLKRFTASESTGKPILFEVFTTVEDESDALKKINELEQSAVSRMKQMTRGLIGDKNTRTLRRIIKG